MGVLRLRGNLDLVQNLHEYFIRFRFADGRLVMQTVGEYVRREEFDVVGVTKALPSNAA